MKKDKMKKEKGIGRVRKSGRGFEFIEFKDLNGEECSLQASSLATTDAVWLGCDNNAKIHHVTGDPLSPRMHMDRKQVKLLVASLMRWLEKGSFK